MKKFIYSILFAVLPLMAVSFVGCSNDDDLPNVDITVDVDNASIVNGTIYVVQGDTLDVTAVNIKNNEANKGAAITNVRYFIDGYYFGTSFFQPYPAYNITDVNTPVGKYQLGITCTVLAVDKSIASGVLSYPIVVVANADEIPSGATTTTITSRMAQE